MKEIILSFLILLLGSFFGYKSAMLKVKIAANNQHLVAVTGDGRVITCHSESPFFTAGD